MIDSELDHFKVIFKYINFKFKLIKKSRQENLRLTFYIKFNNNPK